MLTNTEIHEQEELLQRVVDGDKLSSLEEARLQELNEKAFSKEVS